MTTNLYRRCVSHRNAVRYEHQVLLYQSHIDCGNTTKDNTIEILKTCDEVELEKWEKYYITYFNTSDSEHGLNLQLGGENGKASKKSKENKSRILTGRKFSDKGLKNLTESCRRRCKPILQYDLNGNFIKEWETTGDFARSIGRTKAGNIHEGCLTGKNRYGYLWKYK